eukprot:3924352-Pyramimonas_sp.AAC.2
MNSPPPHRETKRTRVGGCPQLNCYIHYLHLNQCPEQYHFGWQLPALKRIFVSHSTDAIVPNNTFHNTVGNAGRRARAEAEWGGEAACGAGEGVSEESPATAL